MILFNHKYLSQEQLKRLDTYKYACIDSSPVSKYVMHPFWNFVVEFVPLSIAPNVLTLAGFACTLSSAFLLTTFDYRFLASSDLGRDEQAPIPDVVWLVCALNLFLAHTLDGIDGKQARRTKAMSPLGELMDHGVDSWTTMFIAMQIYSFFGSRDFSSSPLRMLFIMWTVFMSYYLAHWEKYNTGVLYLPWSYDISQLFLLGCSLATYLNSYSMWKSSVPILGLYWSQLFELTLYVTLICSCPMPIYTVYTSYKAGKSKYRLLGDMMRPMYPLTHFFLASSLWACCSHSNIIELEPRVYYYTVGTVFSNIACRLIVSQMSSTKCEPVNGCALVFSMVAVYSLVMSPSPAAEASLLKLLAITITLAHLHYAACVVRQLCDHFKINCLSLARPPTESSRQRLLKSSLNSLNNEFTDDFVHLGGDLDSEQILFDKSHLRIATSANSDAGSSGSAGVQM